MGGMPHRLQSAKDKAQKQNFVEGEGGKVEQTVQEEDEEESGQKSPKVQGHGQGGKGIQGSQGHQERHQERHQESHEKGQEVEQHVIIWTVTMKHACRLVCAWVSRCDDSLWAWTRSCELYLVEP